MFEKFMKPKECEDSIHVYVNSRFPEADVKNHNKSHGKMNKRKELKVAVDPSVHQIAKAYSQQAKELSHLNVNRGGTCGSKGFSFEIMHATSERMKGSNVLVLDNNGPSDLVINNIEVQCKCGYHHNNPKFLDGYNTVVVDHGNTELFNKAVNAGYVVEESRVTEVAANRLSSAMQLEGKVLGRTTAPIVGTACSMNGAGMCAAKLTATFMIPVKVGENLYAVTHHEKTIKDAAKDTFITGGKAVAGAYTKTALMTAGQPIVELAGSALAESSAVNLLFSTAELTGSALATTSIGSTLVGAAGMVTSTLGSVVCGVIAAPILPVAGCMMGYGYLKSSMKH